MTAADRERWDAKYAAQVNPARIVPPEWLVAQAAGMPPGRALDLACGQGHAAIWLAQRGWDVTAIDISPVGLAAAQRLATIHDVEVRWVTGDLDDVPLGESAFDLITVFRFLDRTALPARITSALKPRGRVIYETFLGGESAGVAHHVRNPAYLLEPGELPRLFPALKTIHYEEHRSPSEGMARLVAEKTDA